MGAGRQEPAAREAFRIRSVAALLEGKDMIQQLHRHDYYYLLLLEQATGVHTIDFNTYPAGDHCVFFMRPGQVHELRLNAGSTGYLIAFNPEFCTVGDNTAQRMLRKAGNIQYTPCSPEAFRELYTTAAAIFREYTNKYQHYREAVKALIDVLVIGLVRQSESIPRNNNGSYAQEQLEVFTTLIESYVKTHKQAGQYAEMMHLSLFQLNTITKSTLGKTASALIQEQILLEAKRQLLATSSQVSQVAAHLGYEDVSYFIRLFKKHTGLSPEAFRQHSG